MRMKDKGYRSEIAIAIHEMSNDVHDASAVSRVTLRTFDGAYLSVKRPDRLVLPIIQRKGLQAVA